MPRRTRYHHLEGQTEYYPFGARAQLRRRQRRRRLFWAVALVLVCLLIAAFYIRQVVFRGGTPTRPSEEHPFPEAVLVEPLGFEQTNGGISPEDEVAVQDDPNAPLLLPRYIGLHTRNKDMIGWLSIPACNIDTPVMQTPGNNEKYIYLGFDKHYSASGTPFMDVRCSVTKPTANWMIYGHNIAPGVMFTDLLKYRDEEFYRENPTFSFDTIYEEGSWQIIAAFNAVVSMEQDFQYYAFFDAEDEERWEDFLQNCKAASLYDTGVTAEYGDQLITLSTCGKSTPTHERFAIIAKRIN